MIAALTIAGAQAIPAQRAFDLTLVTPTLFLAFAVLAVIAPLAAGGGNELFPPEQLAAYPVRPSTVFAGSLLLAPLNLAWIVQVIILLASSSLLIRNNVVGMMAALFTSLAYIALITTLGQALGWAVMGVRQSRRGRVLVWIAATVTVLTFLVLWRADVLVKLLDASRTRWVIVTGLAESNQDISRWVSGTALMLLLFIAAIPLGARIVGWVQRRPGDSGVQRDARAYRHRSSHMSALAQLRMVDRASVWRSSSLRRGVLVL